MLKFWKPTTKECKAIRAAARADVGRKRVTLEVGERCHLTLEVEHHINIARVTNTANPDVQWSDDTDLWSPVDWCKFTKGVELTEDGRAIIDFYVREPNTRDDIGELLSNIVVYYSNGAIQKIE